MQNDIITCSNTIQMLRSYVEKSDSATVKIIETEIQFVEDELKIILKDLNNQ